MRRHGLPHAAETDITNAHINFLPIVQSLFDESLFFIIATRGGR